MSGSFGSGGLGSFTVYPVEVTCALVGDSTVTESAALLATGDCLFLGDSTSSFEVNLNAAVDTTFTGESSSSFTLISQVMVNAALVADSSFSAIAALTDAESVTFTGVATWTVNSSKVTVISRPKVPVQTAKPPTKPVIRINPPAVIIKRVSLGSFFKGPPTFKGPKTDKKPF